VNFGLGGGSGIDLLAFFDKKGYLSNKPAFFDFF